MQTTMRKLIYVYDVYCGWCYGFGGVVAEVEKEYKDQLQVDVLSGGMVLPDTPQHINLIADAMLSAYRRVEELTGVQFGKDYLWHIEDKEHSDWYPNSLKSAIALSILKSVAPEKSVAFANDLQYSMFYEGRDLTDDEAYRHLLPKYNLDAEEFYTKMHSAEFEEAARYDFALAKQLQATSFPILLLQESPSKFHLMAKGYTDLETVRKRLDNALQEMNS